MQGKRTQGQGGRLGLVTWRGGRVQSNISLVLQVMMVHTERKCTSSLSVQPHFGALVNVNVDNETNAVILFINFLPAHASFSWTGWNYPNGSIMTWNLQLANRKLEVKSASGLSVASKIELIRILSVDPIIFQRRHLVVQAWIVESDLEVMTWWKTWEKSSASYWLVW